MNGFAWDYKPPKSGVIPPGKDRLGSGIPTKKIFLLPRLHSSGGLKPHISSLKNLWFKCQLGFVSKSPSSKCLSLIGPWLQGCDTWITHLARILAFSISEPWMFSLEINIAPPEKKNVWTKVSSEKNTPNLIFNAPKFFRHHITLGQSKKELWHLNQIAYMCFLSMTIIHFIIYQYVWTIATWMEFSLTCN